MRKAAIVVAIIVIAGAVGVGIGIGVDELVQSNSSGSSASTTTSTTSSEPTVGPSDRPVPKDKPNILVYMTDDSTLQEMEYLPVVRELLGDKGATFSNYAVSFPVCCPSRATYITGQYAHNDGVKDNVLPNGGFHKLNSSETLPVWLSNAGFDTASIGKYLNTWGQNGDIQPPPGWDYWYGLIDPSTYQYYNYNVSVNGKAEHFGDSPQDYQTTVLTSAAVNYIDSRKGEKRPFYLSFTPLVPHTQSPELSANANLEKHFAYPVPSPKYKGTLPNIEPPQNPAYDQADISKLPQDVHRKLLTPSTVRFIRRYYEAEVETLLSVNDSMKAIYGALQQTGQLDNTVIFFTSDNGLYHGEHRLPWGKYYLYQEATHLPLLIRGGPFKGGITIPQQASNVDLTPTILALTGVKAQGLVPDGRSLIPFVGHPTFDLGRGVLLENFRDNGKFHTWGIRTIDWVYLDDVQGEQELYHLATDPDEVDNLSGEPQYATIEAQLKARADALEVCAGATCEDSDASRAAHH